MKITKKNIRIWTLGERGWVRIKLKAGQLLTVRLHDEISHFIYTPDIGIFKVEEELINDSVILLYCLYDNIGYATATTSKDVLLNKWQLL